jgi:hypothetical protein
MSIDRVPGCLSFDDMTDILDRRAPETTYVPAAPSSPGVSTVAAPLALLANWRVVYALGWLGLSMVLGYVVSASMPVSLTAPALVAATTAYFVAGTLVALGARQVCVVKGTPVVEDWRTAAAYGADNREKRGDALPVYAPDACGPSGYYTTRSDARLTIRSSSLSADQPLGRSSVLACGGVCDPPRDQGASRRRPRRVWLALARNLQTHAEIDVAVRVRLALCASRRRRAQMRFGTVVVERHG